MIGKVEIFTFHLGESHSCELACSIEFSFKYWSCKNDFLFYMPLCLCFTHLPSLSCSLPLSSLLSNISNLYPFHLKTRCLSFNFTCMMLATPAWWIERGKLPFYTTCPFVISTLKHRGKEVFVFIDISVFIEVCKGYSCFFITLIVLLLCRMIFIYIMDLENGVKGGTCPHF